MASVFYLEHRGPDGKIHRREPVGSLNEARTMLNVMLADLDELEAGDVFTIIDATSYSKGGEK